MSDILPHEKQLWFFSLGYILENNRHENTVRELARSIQTNPILEKVIVSSHSGIDDEIEGLLLDAVIQNRNVQELCFSSTPVDLEDLCRSVRQMTGLKVLKLSHCTEFRNGDVATFTRLFRSNRNLREFCLRRSPVGDAAAQALARSLRFRNSLNHLTLDHCNMSRTGFLAMGDALQQQSVLESLTLSDTDNRFILDQETTAALAQGIERNASLSKVFIFFDQVPPSSATHLFHALAANNKLKDIHVGRIQLDRDGSVAVARLIAEGNALERLVLQGGLDQEEEIKEDANRSSEADIDISLVVRALGTNRTLKSLRLNHWVWRVDDFALSHTPLINNTLEELYLHCHIDSAGVSLLCQLIAKCSRLKHCRVSGHVAFGYDELVIFREGLQQNESLTTLRLVNTQIDDQGAAVLVKSISGHEALESLILSDNKFADDGFMALGRTLNHTVLKTLHLDGNDNVSDRGIRAILDGIKENLSLTDVLLPVGKWSRLQEEELALYTARNRGPRPLLSQDLPLGLWPHALKRASEYKFGMKGRKDLLYYLVREKHVELLANVRRSRKRKRR